MKLVFDANVVIAAFATQGLCASLFEVCLAQHEIFLNPTLLAEIEKTLRLKIRLPSKTIREILVFLQRETVVIGESPAVINRCRDPHDHYLLDLAVQQTCHRLVTGDRDLLVLNQIEETRIVSPRDLWTEFVGNP